MIESAQKAAGTKMMLAVAPVARTASLTVLKTGRSRCRVPPFPGVTPPTIFVPYANISLAWNVALSPVKPCTSTRVVSSMRMLMTVHFLRQDRWRHGRGLGTETERR